MTPWFQDEHVTMYHGDALDVLRELPDGAAQMCVTSPPYWGLRDYGTGTWEGGEPGCDHKEPPRGGRDPATSSKQLTNAGTLAYQYAGVCPKCGARWTDSQLGLEATPEECLSTMVGVFREVRRVLRDDGTLWCNMGDGYNANQGAGFNGQKRQDHANRHAVRKRPLGLKSKDLQGMPWRLAFALQADGWYLRSDIIWHKPNPMPESVTDRPTKAHEYLFLLSKQARYYYDGDAIRVPQKAVKLRGGAWGGGQVGDASGMHRYGREGAVRKFDPRGRNRHDVWTIPTCGYSGSHFATFPPELVRPCILAGCPMGGVVLDPFGGTGTTAWIAQRHARRAIHIDLSEEYLAQALTRRPELLGKERRMFFARTKERKNAWRATAG